MRGGDGEGDHVMSREKRKAAQARRAVLEAFGLSDEPQRSRPGPTSARRDDCEGQLPLFEIPKKNRRMW